MPGWTRHLGNANIASGFLVCYLFAEAAFLMEDGRWKILRILQSIGPFSVYPVQPEAGRNSSASIILGKLESRFTNGSRSISIRACCRSVCENLIFFNQVPLSSGLMYASHNYPESFHLITFFVIISSRSITSASSG